MVYSMSEIIIYLSPLIGYFAGLLTVKINHIMIITQGKLWSSGNAQQRYILIGALASVVFAIILFSFYVNNLKLTLFMTLIFAGIFVIGIKHAMWRFRQYDKILDDLIRALFPNDEKSKEDYEIQINNTLRISKDMLADMQSSQTESLKLLFLIFDSAFTVFFINLIYRKKIVFNRFKNMSTQDKISYMDLWESKDYLVVIPIALKALIGYCYYTSHYSWETISEDGGYKGEVLRRSYIN